MRVCLCALLLTVLALSIAAGDSPAQYTWDPGFAGVSFDNDVFVMTSNGSDLVVGGDFHHVGPIVAENVARWDGSAWHPMGDPGWNSTAALGTYSGEVYGHGYPGAASVNPLKKWDGSGWVAVGDIPGSSTALVLAMVTYQGELVVAGTRGLSVDGHWWACTYDGSVFDGMGNTPDLWQSSGSIADLVEYQGNLYACGYFEMTTDSILTSGIARWDGTSWTAVEGRSVVAGPLVEGIHDGTYAGEGAAMTVYDGKLVVAGSFDRAGDLAVSGICTWDGTTLLWEDVGGGSTEWVRNAATVGGELFAASNGAFGGLLVPFLARWDGTSWSQVGAGIDMPFPWPYPAWSVVSELHDHDGELVLSGMFKKAGGVQARGFAIWNATTYDGKLIPGGNGLDDWAIDLENHDGRLVAAGRFEHAGTVEVNRIGAWDGFQWTGFGTGANDQVNCVLSAGGDLIAGGEFTEIGGLPANHVARWDGAAWNPYGAGTPGEVLDACMHNGELHVGGAIGLNDGFVLRWDGSAWQTIPTTAFSNSVQALESYAGDLVASFTRDTVERWDGANWHSLVSGAFYTLFPYGGELYIGGTGTFVTTSTVRWNGTTVLPLEPSSWIPPPGNGGLRIAHAMAHYDGRLFIAGAPASDGGGLWSSDLANPWEVTANDVNRDIYAMAVFQGRLFLAGIFNETGTTPEGPPGTVSANIGAMGGGVIGIRPDAPGRFSLEQNHPNPFNPTTTIRYVVPNGAAAVSLIVYDVTGAVVRTLWSGPHAAGPASVDWDGTNDGGQPVASGLYLYRLTAGSHSMTRKMVLLK